MPLKRSVEQLNNLSAETKAFGGGRGLGSVIDALITKMNGVMSYQAGGTSVRTTPVFTNTTVALAISNTAYQVNGIAANRSATTVTPTTTTHNVAQNLWASFRVSVQAGGTVTLTKAADVASEALAIANLAAVPGGECDFGYFTLRGGTGAGYVAGTTNLATAAIAGMVVNFYPAIPPVSLIAIPPLT
jgi:hypothetical protein